MVNIKIDFHKVAGIIKPLHGLNNGPVCYGGLIDGYHYYREIEVPYVRLHTPIVLTLEK